MSAKTERNFDKELHLARRNTSFNNVFWLLTKIKKIPKKWLDKFGTRSDVEDFLETKLKDWEEELKNEQN